MAASTSSVTTSTEMMIAAASLSFFRLFGHLIAARFERPQQRLDILVVGARREAAVIERLGDGLAQQLLGIDHGLDAATIWIYIV